MKDAALVVGNFDAEDMRSLTFGSSRTQLELPRQVKRSSLNRSCMTYG